MVTIDYFKSRDFFFYLLLSSLFLELPRTFFSLPRTWPFKIRGAGISAERLLKSPACGLCPPQPLLVNSEARRTLGSVPCEGGLYLQALPLIPSPGPRHVPACLGPGEQGSRLSTLTSLNFPVSRRLEEVGQCR